MTSVIQTTPYTAMFVSILQLMGLAWGKPIQSRAGSDPGAPSAPAQAPSRADQRPTRRQDVKTQTARQQVDAKARPKPVTSRASAAAAVSPSPKAKAAPAAKPSAASALSKARASAPAAARPPKSRVAPVAKAALAPKVSPAPKTTRAVAVPAAKAGKPAKTAKVVPAAQPPVASKPAATPRTTAPAAQRKPPAPAAPAVAVPVAPAPASSAAGIARASRRPSARRAQITVPSMAQTVASTAAKASYAPTMTATVSTPPSPVFAPVKKDPKLANVWKTKPVEQWTDADILAMPDEEYMNDKQLAFFRRKLEQLKQDILDNAGETTEHLREDTVVVPDPADRATIEEEHALELRTRDRERKLLKKIEQSIARIDAGDYGYCDETGEPIGIGRLLARPTATLSLEAQQRRELRQKMFGD
ncbi:MAG: hypothetical protein Fur0019_05690 [Tibeticola sp.]